MYMYGSSWTYILKTCDYLKNLFVSIKITSTAVLKHIWTNEIKKQPKKKQKTKVNVFLVNNSLRIFSVK